MAGEEETVSILVRIRQKAVKFALSSTSRLIKKFSKDTTAALSKINKKGGELVTTLTKGIVGAAAAAALALAALTISAIDQAGALEGMSQQTGIAVENLSTLKFAAEQNGSTLDDLTRGLESLSRAQIDVSTNTGEALTSFQALGVEVRDAATGELKDVNSLLLDTADAFSQFKDDAAKATAAQRIFGDTGLIPFLNQGRAGIEDLQKQAKSLGIEFTSKTTKAAAQLSSDLNTLKTAADGLGVSLAVTVLPHITPIANRLGDAAREGRFLNQAWRESVDLLTKLTGFLTGNEDGLKGLQEQILATRQELEIEQELQKENLELQPSIFRSGKRIVELRKESNKAVRTLTQSLAKLEDQFDKALGNRGRRNEKEAKLQKEARLRREKELAEDRARLSGRAGLDIKPPGAGGETEEEKATRSAQERALKIREELGLSEIELLDLQLDRQLEAVGDHEEARLAIEETFAQKRSDVRLEEQIRIGEENQAAEDLAQEAVDRKLERDDMEAELLEARRAEELEKVRGFKEAEAAVNEEFDLLQADLAKRLQDQRLKDTAGFFGSLATIASVGGRRTFGIQKALAKAEAVVNVASGATRALRDLPFPANLAALAKTLITGKKQLDSIEGANPGGGGGLSAGGGGGGIGGGGPAPPPGPVPLEPTPMMGPSQNVTITILNPLGDAEQIAFAIGKTIEGLNEDGLVNIGAVNIG